MERSRKTRRLNTIKWKKRREDKHGDRCSNAKCGICSPHKRFKKASKYNTKKQLI